MVRKIGKPDIPTWALIIMFCSSLFGIIMVSIDLYNRMLEARG